MQNNSIHFSTKRQISRPTLSISLSVNYKLRLQSIHKVVNYPNANQYYSAQRSVVSPLISLNNNNNEKTSRYPRLCNYRRSPVKPLDTGSLFNFGDSRKVVWKVWRDLPRTPHHFPSQVPPPSRGSTTTKQERSNRLCQVD